MINLITLRRRIATLSIFSLAIFCDSSFAQQNKFTMTDTPLMVDESQESNVEKIFGPSLPADYQEELSESIDNGASDSQVTPELPENIDVLTRGPLHEAFATAHQSNPEPSPVITNSPPELIEELPPEYKPDGKNVQWIPGYWAWDDSQGDFILGKRGMARRAPQSPLGPGLLGSSRRTVSVGYRDSGPKNNSRNWVTCQRLLNRSTRARQRQPPVKITFYVPGNWEYQNGRYRWLSGHWQPVVGNWIWIPARYVWTPSGCLYQSGYWDYEFEYRGTCFAPVYFKRPVYLATNYCYRPSYAIQLNIDFLTHVFVRPRCGHYYYGDWYARNYVSYGYKPWVYYRSHYRSYDPLLTYYRCRRSAFDTRYNVVQYLSNQHLFYAKNVHYRPRPTFAAQFNFFSQNNHYRNSDYLRKSHYVRTYSNVRKTAQRNAQRRAREFQTSNNRLARELQRQKHQFKKLQEKEREAHQRKVDQLVRLQRERRKNEIKLASHDAELKTSTRNRHKTLKLPSQVSKEQLRKLRNEFSIENGRNGRSKLNERERELKKSVADARKNAAEIARQRRDRENRLNNDLVKQQRQTRNTNRANLESRNRELEKLTNNGQQQAARDIARKTK